MNDPQKLWQSQPTEPIKMSLDDIRRKVEVFQAKERSSATHAMIVAPVLCGALIMAVFKTSGTISRLGLMVLVCWALYFAYHAYRYLWPRALADDATYQASVDFYRRELQKKLNFRRDLAGLVAMVVGVALFLGPPLSGAIQNPALLTKALPFFVLLTVWFLLSFIFGKRQRSNVRHELDELDRTT